MSFFHAKSSRTFATYLRESVTNFSKTAENQKTAFFLTRVGGLGKEGDSKSFWKKNGNKAEFSPLIYA